MNQITTSTGLLGLPDDLLSLVYQQLDRKDSLGFSVTSRRLHRLFRVNALQPLLAEAVAAGQQDRAETLFRYNPALLLGKCQFSDKAGRQFADMSAWQYAVWAMDIYLVRRMCQYFDAALARIALRQYREMSESGFAAGQHYDIAPLVNALNTLADAATLQLNIDRSIYWITTIRQLQLQLPMVFLQEFSRTDVSFVGNSPFTQPYLERFIAGFNLVFSCPIEWPLRFQSGVALYRYDIMCSRPYRLLAHSQVPAARVLTDNAAAFAKLVTTRQAQIQTEILPLLAEKASTVSAALSTLTHP